MCRGGRGPGIARTAAAVFVVDVSLWGLHQTLRPFLVGHVGAGARRPASLISGRLSTASPDVVERVSFDRFPLPLKSQFHYRVIDRS